MSLYDGTPFLHNNKIITFWIFLIEFQHKNYKTLFTLHQSAITSWHTEVLTGWRVCLTLHHSSPLFTLLIFPFLQHPSENFRRVKSGEEWWRVVKSEWVLFTSRNPCVYRGFRRKGEGWRVKKRLGFYTTHQKKTRCTNSTNTRGHIVSCLALAYYCPVLEQYLAKAR